jgi:RsiW-degrading membrane proteinase PrsW (M82 family)
MVMPSAPGAETLPAVAPAPAPAVATRGYSGWRLVAVSLLILVPALAVIGIVTFIGVRITPTALVVGLVGAILPVPVLVACFLWLDRYQPSPLWLIAACFLWGAGVATSGALVLEGLAASALERLHQPDTLLAVVGAPLAEESFKAALPILLLIFYRRAFSGITDGIVYCGLSATGFAMVENVIYLGQHAWDAESTKGVASGAFAVTATFLLRVPLSGFAHPLFTAMTGIGLGVSARSPRMLVRVVAPVLGLLAAMVLHGTWNLTASLAVKSQYFILYGYFSFYVPIFFAMVGFVLWIRSREGRLSERILPTYAAAGWFSPPEVAALGTLRRRLSARNWARRVAGDAGQTAMRAYQFAATRLAVVRDGLDRGLYPKPADLARALDEEHRLLATVDAYRRVFVGRDPVAPRAWWSGAGYQIQFPDGVVRPVAAPQLPVVPVPVPPPAYAGQYYR